MKETINCLICYNPIAVIKSVDSSFEIEINDFSVCGNCLKNKPIDEIKALVDT